MAKKWTIFALIIGALLLFWHFDLGAHLTLANLKTRQSEFAAFYNDSPVRVIATFFLIYVLVTALSLPGAVIMTLAAGALFGLGIGTLIVSFASSIGATLSFLTSRYLLRDLVVRKFGDKLSAVDRGIERDGAFYLLTLRLIPLFPFFLINLLMGLTSIRTWTYYWVSQVGMFLGTLVYVNAGGQLAKIERLSDIGSPSLLASFAALGILPWLLKWLVTRLRPQAASS